MEEEKSGECRTWEEELYWKHFHSLHFFQILPTDFRHHLKLPTKFTAKVKANLPENVVLKGPSGITCSIKLMNTEDDNVIITGDGWQQFVKNHSLQVKDLLIFKYDRKKCFEVSIFDQASSCEREASYFARICDSDISEQVEKNSSENVPGTSQENDEDQEHVARKNPSRDKRSRIPLKDCSSDTTAHSDSFNDKWEEVGASNEDMSVLEQHNSLKVNGRTVGSYSDARRGGAEVPSNFSRKRKTYTGMLTKVRDRNGQTESAYKSNLVEQNSSKAIAIKATRDRGRELVTHQPKKRNRRTVACYKSNRRPVTETEKEKALEKAEKKATDDSFIMIMSPSHVYKRFSMIIPRRWKHSRFSRINQEMILRVKEKTWATSLCDCNNHGSGRLRGGWKKFALDNFLEEYDICLFVPGGLENGRFVLDVNIFRVVPEVTPSTLLKS